MSVQVEKQVEVPRRSRLVVFRSSVPHRVVTTLQSLADHQVYQVESGRVGSEVYSVSVGCRVLPGRSVVVRPVTPGRMTDLESEPRTVRTSLDVRISVGTCKKITPVRRLTVTDFVEGGSYLLGESPTDVRVVDCDGGVGRVPRALRSHLRRVFPDLVPPGPRVFSTRVDTTSVYDFQSHPHSRNTGSVVGTTVLTSGGPG